MTIPTTGLPTIQTIFLFPFFSLIFPSYPADLHALNVSEQPLAKLGDYIEANYKPLAFACLLTCRLAS
jgi:hypothetical protein